MRSFLSRGLLAALLLTVMPLTPGCAAQVPDDSLGTGAREDALAGNELDFVSRLSAGLNHSLYVTRAGTVWSWGLNAQGQLGDGTLLQRLTPTQVAGLTRVKAVATGNNHSLALRDDGTVWAWGSNAEGQLGGGSTSTRPAPLLVEGLSRVTARRYLEHFVSTGQAEVRLRYGGAGRPERRYRRP